MLFAERLLSGIYEFIMNLKLKTKAVSNLLRWFLANESKKEKLRERIERSTLYEKGVSSERKEETKLLCYAPCSKPLGAYFITPGLHPLGVDHPKFTDLCSMLASLGYVVYAPFAKDYRVLCIKPCTYEDYASAFDRVCLDLKNKGYSFKVNVFSISFGSLLALQLAGDLKRKDSVNSVIIFGGYGDWRSTCDEVIEKALFGRVENGYGDIRSIPAVFNHIVEYADDISKESAKKLRERWLRYMTISWMDDETYMNRNKCEELALSFVKDLTAEEKSFFLKGCGLEEGTFQLYHALEKKGNYNHLDPLKNVSQISCAMYLLHGKHDRLIPSSQQKIIKEALPAKTLKRLVLTKLYAHTARNTEGSSFLRVLGTLPELRNLLRIFLTISLPNSSGKPRGQMFKKKAKLSSYTSHRF